jgi:hypothetical protein
VEFSITTSGVFGTFRSISKATGLAIGAYFSGYSIFSRAISLYLFFIPSNPFK